MLIVMKYKHIFIFSRTIFVVKDQFRNEELYSSLSSRQENRIDMVFDFLFLEKGGKMIKISK